MGEPSKSPWASLFPLCAAVALYKIDATIVTVALPTIQRELDVSPAALAWIVSAYLLALASVIPLAGALGDRFGRRKVFLIGLAMFTFGSTGCALSSSQEMLIGFRIVQGAAAGLRWCLADSLIDSIVHIRRGSRVARLSLAIVPAT